MSEQAEVVKLRPSNKDDIPFIFNSWLKSFKVSLVNRGMDNTTYYAYHHDMLAALLARSACIVACDPKDERQIFGYIVVEKAGPVTYLHWCYVKDIYRNLGIARTLEKEAAPGENGVYTFFTRYGDKLTRERKYKYVPFYVRVRQYEAANPGNQ